MWDYDPASGRYLQADPLGLVDGASVDRYAGQNSVMNSDPTGQCFGPFIAWAPACADAAWAAISVYIGWLLDPDCYTWEEGGRDTAIGAAFGPLGAYGRAGAAGASAAANHADDAARATSGRGSGAADDIAKSTRTRPYPGRDGATSEHIVEKIGGETTSITHRVTARLGR